VKGFDLLELPKELRRFSAALMNNKPETINFFQQPSREREIPFLSLRQIKTFNQEEKET